MAQARPRVEKFLKKTNAKLHDASTASESIAADVVCNLIKKYSRRINYDALKNLFDGYSAGAVGANATPLEVALSDKEEDMYTIDDKSDGECVCVAVEGSGGGLGMSAPAPRRGTDKAGKKRMEGADADGETGMDGEDIEMRKKGNEYARDEGYEQEV
ncbi:hypothetical protein DFH11DRAFT_1632089 [Phellopilus nigrolimitatus]|nr:hypothetical protein DFH11DRAFT_1632089 [Phellopilus nigrolimitatus]